MKSICPSCAHTINFEYSPLEFSALTCYECEYAIYYTGGLSREVINIRFSYILYKLFIDELYDNSYLHELYSYEICGGKIQQGKIILNYTGNKKYLINYQMPAETVEKKINLYQLFQ